MSEPVDAPVARPRRWWLAFLLNLVFPPTGYAYVGAWMAVALTAGAVLMGAVALNQWALIRPPGIYVLGPNGFLYGAVAFAVALGGHAAWLARKAPPRTGPSLAVIYVAPWALLLIANGALQTFWPNPVYTVGVVSMEPTLKAEDIVMVDGARGTCARPGLKPGDVVVFRRQGAPMLSRIVAGPGQTVAMQSGLLLIDGKIVRRELKGSTPATGTMTADARLIEVEETLPGGARYRTQDLGADGALDEIAPITLGPNLWYLMGDNRDNAIDSRVNGPVMGVDICAVAVSIVFAEDQRRVGRKP